MASADELFHKIGLVVFEEDQGEGLSLLIQNGMILARWLGARIEVYRLGGIFVDGVLESLERDTCDLGMMQLHKSGSIPLGKSQLLERSRIPFLMVPQRLILRWPPFLSLSIPISGEREFSPALVLGLRLGNQLKLDVDLIHIQEESPGGDHIYYEYSHLLDELLARSSPFSSVSDFQCVRQFCHFRGDVVTQISSALSDSTSKLLVLDWKGSFLGGHARVIKQILATAKSPLILVRQQEGVRSFLKVG